MQIRYWLSTQGAHWAALSDERTASEDANI